MKNKFNFLIALVMLSLLSLTFVSAATMTRTVPSTSSGSFTAVYTVSGSGTWGASIIDNVAGGCKFPDGSTQLKTVMLSSDGMTKSITVTAPTSGTCVFTGDYKFGTDAVVNFASGTTTIGSGTCTPSCTGKVCGDNGCGGSCGTCSGVCSNGACVTACPTGQTKCSDGTCQASCTTTGDCIFNLGTFCVEWWMIAIGVGLVVVLLITKK